MIERAPLLFALQSTRELGDKVAAALGVPLQAMQAGLDTFRFWT